MLRTRNQAQHPKSTPISRPRGGDAPPLTPAAPHREEHLLSQPRLGPVTHEGCGDTGKPPEHHSQAVEPALCAAGSPPDIGLVAFKEDMLGLGGGHSENTPYVITIFSCAAQLRCEGWHSGYGELDVHHSSLSGTLARLSGRPLPCSCQRGSGSFTGHNAFDEAAHLREWETLPPAGCPCVWN